MPEQKVQTSDTGQKTSTAEQTAVDVYCFIVLYTFWG